MCGWRNTGIMVPSYNKFALASLSITVTFFLLQTMFLVKNECRFSSFRYVQARYGDASAMYVRSDVKSDVEPQLPLQRSIHERHLLSGLASKRRLTIGIPTVKRQDGSYFPEMLRSMLNKTSEHQLKHIIFVVLLADIENTIWKAEMEAAIKLNYSDHIESGSLVVTQVPFSFYAKLNVSTEDKYLYWRTKQNFDYAYLMKYSANLSTYYMQMEDDVIASDGYYDTIDNFIRKQTDDNWICLEFSELGFIGKLYHSKHISDLASMLLMFNRQQPVDYTYKYFNLLMSQGTTIIHKPTLFQHMGYHSSLKEKVQPLKDKYFYWPNKQYKGDNPPAHVQTSMDSYADFPAVAAYSKEPGYFWSSKGPTEGDTFTVVFDSPQAVENIVVDSGCEEHPGDRLYNGILSVSPNLTQLENQPTCHDFVQVGTFIDGRVNVTDVISKMGVFKIKCMEIKATKAQAEWLIIREIAVMLKREK